MFEQPLDGAKRALTALRSSLVFNRALRNELASGNTVLPPGFVAHPPYDEWRMLDHAVAFTQLYQIYESLVHDCISEWLSDLSKLVPYSKLSEKVQSTHRNGIGYILQNLGGRRFSALTPTTLIKEYQDAISDEPHYKLHADAFLLHDRNLKFDELQRVVASCGIDLPLIEWLKNHPLTDKHDSFQLIGTSTPDKAIASLVDLRNEASHATLQTGEILGEEVVVAYVDFVASLAEAIVEAFTHEALKCHSEHGAWSASGRVNLVLQNDKTICVAPLASCTVKPGLSIYLRGKNYCKRALVQEVQVDGVTVDFRTIGLNAEVIGLRLNIDGMKNSDIYIQTLVPPTPIQPPDEVDLDLRDSEIDDGLSQSPGNELAIDTSNF